MIIGVGVDTVDVARFEQKLMRTPRLNDRLFTPAERTLTSRSRAARFAAKEALIKALGGSSVFDEAGNEVHLSWQDMEISQAHDARPRFSETAGLSSVLGVCGVHYVHLSLTHDAGVATAFVIAERSENDSEQQHHEPGGFQHGEGR
jgi:holo-[acyl-carrier protein] synthase